MNDIKNSPLSTAVLQAAHSEPVFRPGMVWRDTDGIPINAHGAGMLFHEGVYYWYGEFKTTGEEGNRAQVGVSCYSSRDLYTWRNEGIVLPVSDDPDSDIVRDCIIERPKVLFCRRTNTFVLWFHLELKGQGYSAARVGVAVSDSPTGPFIYRESFRPNGEMSRDMTLFIDPSSPDSAAYLFCASEHNKTLHICHLTDDYLGVTDTWVRAFEGRSMEAPAVCHHEGRYWLVASGCTGWAPNAARSAVADHPLGPWTELGNPCVGPNADLTFDGQSTCILPVSGKAGSHIFLADRWNPENPIDGRYLWLPMEFSADGFTIHWRDAWSPDGVPESAAPPSSLAHHRTRRKPGRKSGRRNVMLRAAIIGLLGLICLHPAVTEAASPKKGFAVVVRKGGVWRGQVTALNAKWFYSWGADEPEDMPEGVEFVPMEWGYYGNKDDKLVTRMTKVKAQPNVHILLGFNEPDGKKQANLSVDKALEGWPYLEQTGLTLGSPAAVHADGTWLKSFMQQADEKKYRVDFITIHWYGGANPQAFLGYLKRVYDLYRRPIWVTEFCPADWSGQHRVTAQQTMDFMKAVVPAMDNMPYVQRYSWFSASPDSMALGAGALFNKDGSLTDLGKFYASL